jgi:hypothetical protein
MSKLPSFQFYPGDWMKDPALSICSAGARGVWLDVLCLMFESPRRGYLMTNGKPWTLEQIAIALRGDWQENLIYLRELVHNGVMKQVEASRRSRKCPRHLGAFFSARLVTDECHREAWRQQKRRQRIENNRSHSAPCPPLSSSSSSSSSSKLNSTPPISPPPGGQNHSSNQATRQTVYLEWMRELIEIKATKLATRDQRDLGKLGALHPKYVVEWLRGRGYDARLMSAEEVECLTEKAKSAKA